ncbi:hypothetical protein DVH24_014188 [Malus domestica]|uniref:DDE Tnp4 domain-containing protein n=1 Tax=Malus domestica TaxID=3750 RepID=A0A498JIT9_MALDO|nr:hypothetical protein DVH24_014188 [Malus domestica]
MHFAFRYVSKNGLGVIDGTHIYAWALTKKNSYRLCVIQNVVERCIGVLKNRFPILMLMPSYPINSHCMLYVHNFIRMQ